MKKVLVILLAMMMTAVMFAGCAQPTETSEETASVQPEEVASDDAAETVDTEETVQDDEIVIGLSNANNANEHNVVYLDAAKAYIAEKYPNVKLLDVDGAGDANTQVSQCETFATQNVDVVVMNPYDAEGCAAGAQICNDAGIPIMTSKAQLADQSLVACYAGSDDFSAGQIEMNYIAELLSGKGNIVILEGPTGISAAILRNEGIYDVLANYPDINVLYTQPADWDRALGMETMENWLQLGDDIDAIVAHNDEMALGAYDALVAAGLEDEIPVIGIDAIPAAMESVVEDGLIATVLQDAVAIAHMTIDVAVMLANGEDVDPVYDVPFVLLTVDNIQDFM